MKLMKSKLFVSLVAAVLCMAAFSMTAFASGDDWCEYGDYNTPDPTPSAAVTETSAPEPGATPSPAPVVPAQPGTPTPEQQDPDPSGDGEISSGKPLTPSGNLDLVDDVLQVSGGAGNDAENGAKPGGSDALEEKQFITVQSKNGNYFYIVIDRCGDKENVYFLNQVDEADLLALMEGDAPEEKPPVCTCTDKCVVGDINTACPVCQSAMSECTGREPEPEPVGEPDTEPEKEESRSGNTGLLLIVLVAVLAGGGAVYYFKLRKPKTDTRGPIDLDDYDFGEDGEDDEDDYPLEKDDAEDEDSGK